jgi:hypothetical protein
VTTVEPAQRPTGNGVVLHRELVLLGSAVVISWCSTCKAAARRPAQAVGGGARLETGSANGPRSTMASVEAFANALDVEVREVELGQRAAEKLGYRFMTGDGDHCRAAQRYNVTQEQLLIVDDRRPNFWERVRTDSAKLYCYFSATALSEMAKDKLVLVGRTIAQSLPDDGCGLRARAVAPFCGAGQTSGRG